MLTGIRPERAGAEGATTRTSRYRVLGAAVGKRTRSLRAMGPGDDVDISGFLREKISGGFDEPLDLPVLLARERTADVELDVGSERDAVPRRASARLLEWRRGNACLGQASREERGRLFRRRLWRAQRVLHGVRRGLP